MLSRLMNLKDRKIPICGGIYVQAKCYSIVMALVFSTLFALCATPIALGQLPRLPNPWIWFSGFTTACITLLLVPLCILLKFRFLLIPATALYLLMVLLSWIFVSALLSIVFVLDLGLVELLLGRFLDMKTILKDPSGRMTIRMISLVCATWTMFWSQIPFGCAVALLKSYWQIRDVKMSRMSMLQEERKSRLYELEPNPSIESVSFEESA